MASKVSFQDIIDIHHWQKMQDHFAEVIKLTVRTVDEKGMAISEPSNPTKLCSEVLKDSDLWMSVCRGCLLEPKLSKKDKSGPGREIKEDIYCNSIGLHNYSIPVKISRRQIIAYLMIGPVLVGPRQRPSTYQKILEDKGVNFVEFIDGLIEINHFSFSGIQSVIELISEISCYIARLRYEKFRLERSILKFAVLKKRIQKVFLDRLLESLLNVAFDATNAEVGSIMVFNEKTGELYIKLNRGLKKDIVKSARLKPGEGIAGLVVQRSKPLLLDDKITAKRIRERFTRPELKSAVVVPLSIKGETFGVINLGTSNPANKFDTQKVNLLSQLIRLVDVSLSSNIPV